ncbi:MAG: ROK family protein [Planctomycetes bacterium]|nr:ROK family protein [Planctomycetota bacterium]
MTEVVLGIDVGGTKTLAAAFAAESLLGTRAGQAAPTALDALRVPTAATAGPNGIVDQLAGLVERLRSHVGAPRAVGVGFPGLIDHRDGVVHSSVILPGWDGGFALAAALRERCGMPVLADNDATCAGWGEYLVRRGEVEHLLVLTIGTGIGGAIVLGGRLHRGASNTSAEFGNMTIDWRGEDHSSGNRGCLNTLASGTAIARRAWRAGACGALGEPPTLEQIATAAAAGDTAAAEAIETGAEALGTGIANLLNAFNPGCVALTGGVLGLGPRWLSTVRKTALSRAFPLNAAHANIEECRAGQLAGAFGAAALAWDRFGAVR